MKLIILLFLGYSVYKIVHFLLPIFKMKSKLNQQETKADFRRKVRNMDIQDAEFEDLWNLKNMYLVCTTDRGEESARKSYGSYDGMDLRKEFVEMINDKGLKSKVRANKSGCLDDCEHGLAGQIYTEGHWYLGFAKKDLIRIFDTSIYSNKPAPELVVDDSQLKNN